MHLHDKSFNLPRHKIEKFENLCQQIFHINNFEQLCQFFWGGGGGAEEGGIDPQVGNPWTIRLYAWLWGKIVIDYIRKTARVSQYAYTRMYISCSTTN